MENKIARLNLEIDEKQKVMEELKSRIEELLKDAEALEDKIGELAQEEDKTTVKSRSLNATFEKLKETDDRENITKVLQLLKHVNQQLDQVKTEMAELLKEQEQLDNKIQDFKSQIENTATQIQELQDDIESIIELAKMRKSSAIVRVSGTIYDRTAIRSPKASFTVRDNLKRVTIQEVKKANTGSEEEWEMVVSSLK
jgi:chromosome segregation ATPase